MEYRLISAQDCEAENAFSRFTDYLEKWLEAGWRVSPGTYHSATSRRPPRLAGYSASVIEDSYTPVFMICVQVEREVSEDA